MTARIIPLTMERRLRYSVKLAQRGQLAVQRAERRKRHGTMLLIRRNAPSTALCDGTCGQHIWPGDRETFDMTSERRWCARCWTVKA